MFPLYDSIQSYKTPLITWFIIAANIVIFWLELSGGEQFIMRYGLVPSQVSAGDVATWYSFFTSMFLHGGWFHLFSNMWFLRIFGDNVEAAFGSIRYLLFYLIAGIIAGFVQYIAAPESTIPMIGASGAIAGVLGAYVILFSHARISSLVFLGFYITVLEIPAVIYLPYWFLLQLLSGVGQVSAGTIATSGGVAFLAHAGGFIAGVIAAILIKKTDD